MSHETTLPNELVLPQEEGNNNYQSGWYNKNGSTTPPAVSPGTPGDAYGKPSSKKTVTRFEHSEILEHYLEYPLPECVKNVMEKPDINTIISLEAIPPVTLTLTSFSDEETTRFWNDVSKMNQKKGRVNEDDMNLNTAGGIKGNIYHPKHLGSATNASAAEHLQPSYLLNRSNKRPSAMESSNWRERPMTQPPPPLQANAPSQSPNRNQAIGNNYKSSSHYEVIHKNRNNYVKGNNNNNNNNSSSESESEEEGVDHESLKQMMKNGLKKQQTTTTPITPSNNQSNTTPLPTPDSDNEDISNNQNLPQFTPVIRTNPNPTPSTGSPQLQSSNIPNQSVLISNLQPSPVAIEKKNEPIKSANNNTNSWSIPVVQSIPLTSNIIPTWNNNSQPVQSIQPVIQPIIPQPIQQPVVLEYYYKDPKNIERGPYSSEKMRNWFDAGYFTSDLQIRIQNSEYKRLGAMFPNIKQSFLIYPNIENNNNIEADKRNNWSIPIQSPLQVQQPNIIYGIQPVPSNNNNNRKIINPQQQQQQQQQSNEVKWNKPVINPISLNDIQKEEQLRIKQQQQQQQSSLMSNDMDKERSKITVPQPSTSPSSIWGTNPIIPQQQQSSSSPSPPALSLTEIQKQEQLRMQQLQQQDNIIRQQQTSSSWNISQAPSLTLTEIQKQEQLRMQQLQQQQQQQQQQMQQQQQQQMQQSMNNNNNNNIRSRTAWGTPAVVKVESESLDKIQEKQMEELKDKNRTSGSTLSDIVRNSALAGSSAKSSWGIPVSAPAPVKSLEQLQREEIEKKLKMEREMNSNSTIQQSPSPLSLSLSPPQSITSTAATNGNSAWKGVKKETVINSNVIGNNRMNNNNNIPKFSPPQQSYNNNNNGMFWESAGSKGDDKDNTDNNAKLLNGDFAEWCKAGHTDISLLVSCLSLDSSAKIREFIRDLYGSKPEVSNFATEFIRRKDKMNNNERKRGKK